MPAEVNGPLLDIAAIIAGGRDKSRETVGIFHFVGISVSKLPPFPPHRLQQHKEAKQYFYFLR